ncbi:MAG: ABC transporter permease [Verrucomicrobia bacterium]|nr:ABC transporter permease [Verrucomicrobiota bacterium]
MNWKGWLLGRRELGLGLVCVIIAFVFQLISPYFLTSQNLTTILKNSVELLLVSLGVSFILATAGIDIAVGGAMGICAIFVGWGVQNGWSLAVTCLIGPIIGTALGLVSASLIVWGRIPPIIATLGLFGVYRAAIFLLLGGSWISGLPDLLGGVVNRSIIGFPFVGLFILIVYAISWLVLRWMPLGIAILATGGNERAARLSGVNIGKTKFFVYGFTGLLVGLAALFYVARYRNVETSTGGLVALDAIVASVLGGSSVLGGKANLLGTMLGVLLVRLLQNGFVLVGLPSLWEQVITGALLLLILVFDAVLADRGPLRSVVTQ